MSLFAFFLSVMSLGLFAPALPTPKPFVPTFSVSKKPPFKIDKDQAYTFGYLEVLEDRSRPEGPTLKLPVYIFKSRSTTPQPDPVFYTVGGPGASSMPSAPYMEYYRYLDDRDLILFEQRGTYYAKPHLDCPEWAAASTQAVDPRLTEVQSQQLYQDAARACRDRLEKQGIDLNAYHTRATAADIEDLRVALGISQWNILSVSYSTKIAQVLMRDYPTAIRSVVMDSPLPLEVNYEEEHAGNLMAAFTSLLADCAADSACAQAYPGLAQRFWQYLTDKTEEPLEIQVPHPATKDLLSFRLRGKDLINLFAIDAHGSIPDIPQQMQTLLSGDHQFLTERLQSLLEGEGSSAGIGMRLSVWCAEEMAFSEDMRIAEEQNRYAPIRGYATEIFSREVCGIWGVEVLPAEDNQPVSSDIPTLLLNGSYDPLTSPQWATQMLPHLTNGHQLVFEGWGHAPIHNWGQPCAMQASQDFFNDPTRTPEPECSASRKWTGSR